MVAVLALVATACGPSNTFSGSVAGLTFTPKEAASFLFDAGNGQVGMQVVVGDVAGLCAKLQQGISPKGASLLQLAFIAHDAAGNPLDLTTGTYGVQTSETISGLQSFAFFDKLDASCASTFGTDQSPTSTGGSMTIGSFSRSNNSIAASGTYDVTFGTDHVTGSYGSAACPNVAETFSSCQ